MEDAFGKRSKHSGEFGEEYRAKVMHTVWPNWCCRAILGDTLLHYPTF